MINLTCIPLINQFSDNSLNISILFFSDPLSAPLLLLTTWLLPLIIIASQGHIYKEPIIQKKLYITIIVILQVSLIITFSANELIIFYILFETTLVPTLVIITRWGGQNERLNAGIYFLFYTLAGSLPLLIALLYSQSTLGSLNILLIQYYIDISPHNGNTYVL